MKRTLTGLCALCLIVSGAYAQRPLIGEGASAKQTEPSSSIESLLDTNATPAPKAKSATRKLAVDPMEDLESRPLAPAPRTGTTAKALTPEAVAPDVALKLGLVVGIMVLGGFGWRAFRMGRRPQEEDVAGTPIARLELVEQIKLSPQQTLSVVRWGGQRLLVGATASNITLLAEAAEEARAPRSVPASVPAPLPAPTPVSSAPAPAVAATPDRFEGILERLRAQEAEMLDETDTPAMNYATERPRAPRRSLFGGGKG